MCLSVLLAVTLTLPVCEVTERPDRETKVFPGVVKSIDRVDIVPQVCGEILEIGFTDGEIVKKGDMLYKLDDVRYVAEVKNAEAKINAVDDVWYFKSTSNAKGNYSCNVMFRPGVNPDIALVNVQNAVKRAEKKLPSLRRSRAVSPAFT